MAFSAAEVTRNLMPKEMPDPIRSNLRFSMYNVQRDKENKDQTSLNTHPYKVQSVLVAFQGDRTMVK